MALESLVEFRKKEIEATRLINSKGLDFMRDMIKDTKKPKSESEN